MAIHRAKRPASRSGEERQADAEAERTKVTYSLPAALVDTLDRHAADRRRPKSTVVSEALAFYFAEQDNQALAAVYAQAASDPAFAADNAAVLADFAALDLEPERER